MPAAVIMRPVEATPLVNRRPGAAIVGRPVGSNACGASKNNCQRANAKLKYRFRGKANHRLSPFSTKLASSFMLIGRQSKCESLS
jgi:hypothetical protein